MSNLEAERKAFETFATTLDLDILKVRQTTDSPWEYSDCNTDYAWLAWKYRAYMTASTAEPVAKAIHYPDCWDTAAYPTLESALKEMYAFFKCSECAPSSQITASGVPEGFKLVPIEPTEEMLREGRYSVDCPVSGNETSFRDIWQAMLYASPARELEGRDK